jgi:hypothetical protein
MLSPHRGMMLIVVHITTETHRWQVLKLMTSLDDCQEQLQTCERELQQALLRHRSVVTLNAQLDDEVVCCTAGVGHCNIPCMHFHSCICACACAMWGSYTEVELIEMYCVKSSQIAEPVLRSFVNKSMPSIG